MAASNTGRAALSYAAKTPNNAPTSGMYAGPSEFPDTDGPVRFLIGMLLSGWRSNGRLRRRMGAQLLATQYARFRIEAPHRTEVHPRHSTLSEDLFSRLLQRRGVAGTCKAGIA